MIVDALLNTRSSGLSGNAIANLLFGVRDVPLPTLTGKTISAESALGYSPVFRAITLMAQKYAQVPVQLHKINTDGSFKQVTDHRAIHALTVMPNPEMDIVTFKKLMIILRYMRGQMFCEKAISADGSAIYLWPLTSPNMRIQRDWSTQELEYTYSYNRYQEHEQKEGFIRKFTADELLIMLDFTLNGIQGISRITIAREAIALGLSYEEYAARFMGNDATPRGFIVSKANLKKETKTEMREEWQKALTGENRGKIGILDGEIDWKSTGLSQKDAEFIQGRTFQISEVSRWFDGIPLHMLGDNSHATFSNIEQQNLEFLTDCLDPLLVAQEAAYNRALLTDEEIASGFRFAHDRSALEAADQKTTAEASEKDVMSGIKTLNEARRARGLNPVEGGDINYGNLGYGPRNVGVMTTNEIRILAGLEPIEGADVIMGLKSQQPETPDPADPSDKNNALGNESNVGQPEPVAETKAVDKKAAPAAAATNKAAVKRALTPIFEDAFDRVIRKETMKIETLMKKRTTGDAVSELIDISEGIDDYVRAALKPAMETALVLIDGLDQAQCDDFLVKVGLRHQEETLRKLQHPLKNLSGADQVLEVREIVADWRENRAKARAEEEITNLLEMMKP